MLPSVPLVPPTFGLGGWDMSPTCPLGFGDVAWEWHWKGTHPQGGFLGGVMMRTHPLGRPSMCTTGVDATLALSPKATKRPRLWEQPQGCTTPVSPPPHPHRMCPPRPRVLRSPPALAAAVTCHRVPLSPPRLMEMAGDGAGAAALSPCHGPAGAQPRRGRLFGVAVTPEHGLAVPVVALACAWLSQQPLPLVVASRPATHPVVDPNGCLGDLSCPTAWVP